MFKQSSKDLNLLLVKQVLFLLINYFFLVVPEPPFKVLLSSEIDIFSKLFSSLLVLAVAWAMWIPCLEKTHNYINFSWETISWYSACFHAFFAFLSIFLKVATLVGIVSAMFSVYKAVIDLLIGVVLWTLVFLVLSLFCLLLGLSSFLLFFFSVGTVLSVLECGF